MTEHCFCEDYEPPEFYHLDTHRARKLHRCTECGRAIQPGETPDEDDRQLPEVWIRRSGEIVPPGSGIDFFGGDEVMYRVGKKSAGRLLDGREWNEVPT